MGYHVSFETRVRLGPLGCDMIGSVSTTFMGNLETSKCLVNAHV